MEFRVHEGRELPHALHEALGRYRHAVFIERLGWALARPANTRECDEFDSLRTVYVVALERGEVVGCARLLCTVRPYLLQQHFSGLLAEPAPVDAGTWELSRFAAGPAQGRRIGSDTAALLRATLVAAAEQGAHTLVGVTFASLERRFRALGATLERMGPPALLEGRAIVACRMNVARSLRGLPPPIASASPVRPPTLPAHLNGPPSLGSALRNLSFPESLDVIR